MNWFAPPIWEGAECWIIGGGSSIPYEFGVPEEIIKGVTFGERKSSAYSEYLAPIHDKHIIGINNVYQIGDWIDVEFFGDNAWYLAHRIALARWHGLKISCAPRFDKNKGKEGIKYLAKNKDKKYGITSDPTMVSWNQNSGCAAISIAHHFGVKRIILLGFDMSLGAGNISHWHGSHGNLRRKALKRGNKDPFRKHLEGFPQIAKDAEDMGIEIINASSISTIKEFPKVPLKYLL